MKRNYTATAQKFKQENKDWKGYGFCDKNAWGRWTAMGILQGRTTDS